MLPCAADPFFQYPRNVVVTSNGDVAMPILYYEASQLMAFFWLDYDKVKTLISERLDVVRFGSKALGVIAFYEYRNTSIGSYNEVGTAIACVPKGTKQPRWPMLSLFNRLDNNVIGFNVIDLPVTSEAACAAGRDIWSYPKFVSPIDFSLRDGCFDGRVQHPSDAEPVFLLSGCMGPGIGHPLIDLILYSEHRGEMLRTLVNIRSTGRVCLPGSMLVSISRDNHPMAERMVAMGLQHAKPAFVTHTHGLQLRLNSGAVLP